LLHLRYVFRPEDELGKSHNLLWINAYNAQGVDFEYIRAYCLRQITFEYLLSDAPFIASELMRQNLVESIREIMDYSAL